MHLVRNAVDHGIEDPAEREAAGKPAEGVDRDPRLPRRRSGHDRDAATTAAGSTSRRSGTAAIERGLIDAGHRQDTQRARHDRAHLPARLLDRRQGHEPVGPRRRHGRRQDQRRTDRRQRRGHDRARQRHHLHPEDPADARDRPGAARHLAAASATRSPRSTWSSSCARRPSRSRTSTARRSTGCATACYRSCPWRRELGVESHAQTEAARCPIVVLQADDRRFGLIVDGVHRLGRDRGQAARRLPEGRRHVRRRDDPRRRPRRPDPGRARARPARPRADERAGARAPSEPRGDARTIRGRPGRAARVRRPRGRAHGDPARARSPGSRSSRGPSSSTPARSPSSSTARRSCTSSTSRD